MKGEATLKKRFNLKSRRQIENLFLVGNTYKSYPLIVKFEFSQAADQEIFSVGFSVSKKKFKKAVDRNRIKRQMREGFRNNNSLLIKTLKECGTKITMMFIYTGRDMVDSEKIHKSILHLIRQIADHQPKSVINSDIVQSTEKKSIKYEKK